MNGSDLKCYNIYYKHIGDLIDTSKKEKVVDENKLNCGEMIEVYLFIRLFILKLLIIFVNSIYSKRDNTKEESLII